MTPAGAVEFSGLGMLPAGLGSGASALSADGGVAVGTAYAGNGDIHAFRWTASGGMADIGGVYRYSEAMGVSADGGVVVGIYDSNGDGKYEAFRWTSAGLVGLGLPAGGYDTAFARGVSGDGNIVVGDVSGSDGRRQAVTWTGGAGSTLLGFLAGNDRSIATGASHDGSVVVGASWSAGAGGTQAFRYTQAGGMVGLGYLGSGDYSFANAVSSDGQVVVGHARNASREYEAFRWASGSGMVALGLLANWVSSDATAVSRDGSVIVGSGYNRVIDGDEAFRWTQATGVKTISSLLAAGGVNIGGWQLSTASGVSADGSVVVGAGTNPAGWNEAYIARLGIPSAGGSSGGGTVLIGVVDFSNSVASLQALSHLSSEVARAGVASAAPGLSGLAGWSAAPVYQHVSGSRGDLGGAALTWRQPGIAVAGQMGRVEARTTGLHDGGRGDYRGGWAGAAASLGLGRLLGMPAVDGLELEAAVRTGRYDADINRNYLNGVSVETARGNTSSRDTTALARLGWHFPVMENVQLTPYLQWMQNRIRIDGYDETGGAMAGRVSAQKQREVETSAGVSAAWRISPELELRGRYSLNHLHDDTGAQVGVTVAGIGTFAVGGGKYDTNWQEFGLGADWAVSDRIRVNASATRTAGSNYPENWSAGVAVNFGL